MTPDAEKRPELQDLELALEGSDPELWAFLGEVHAADLAGWLEEVAEDQARRVVGLLGPERRGELLQFSDEELRRELLGGLDAAGLAEVVQLLPADDVVDLLALLDAERFEEVLRLVGPGRARELRALASYGEDTAGGLMTTEFVAVPADAHVLDAIKEIKAEEGPRGLEEVGVFVVDEAHRPIGFVSDRDLLTTGIHTPIREVMDTDLITVSAATDQEDVANLVSKYGLEAVPVVDERGVLIGVVSAEDAQEVLEEELEEDIRRLVGTSPVEQTRLGILRRVRERLPLQGLTVAGGLTTAWILDRALPGGEQRGATGDVLRYLPLIIGLAGNVGIQSSTVLVRAFATGELTEERQASVLGAEVVVGLLIGLFCGLTTFGIASYLEGSGQADYGFGLAVGGAMSVAVTWAAFLGCIVPIVCQRFGVDPAIVAGPFLITLSDVSGAAIFVGVAHATLQAGGVGG